MYQQIDLVGEDVTGLAVKNVATSPKHANRMTKLLIAGACACALAFGVVFTTRIQQQPQETLEHLFYSAALPTTRISTSAIFATEEEGKKTYWPVQKQTGDASSSSNTAATTDISSEDASGYPSALLELVPSDETIATFEEKSMLGPEKMDAEKGNIDTDTLIKLTKGFLIALNGDAASLKSRMANSFRFVAPVVGPLKKDPFVQAFGSFKVQEAFPDISENYHHFRRDPFEDNRIWFSTRPRGTNSGPWFGGSLKASNKYVDQTPQTMSVTFDKKGMVEKFTIGYPMDRELGNSGGLGGIYGLLYASGYGLPFPEAQPFKPSKRYRFFQKFGFTFNKLKEFFKRNK